MQPSPERSRPSLRARLAAPGTPEGTLKLLGAVALALFVAAIAALYLVQRGLVGAQQQLTAQALPAQRAVHQLDAALGSAYRRQARLARSEQPAELDALRDRSALERALREAERTLSAGSGADGGGVPSAARASLGAKLAAFLASGAELLAATERRLAAEAAFAQQRGAVDEALRGLIAATQSLAGVARLDYVVTLRRIAQAMETSGKPPPGLVRQLTVGDTRTLSEDTAELADAARTLARHTGEIALAPHADALDALTDDALAQSRAQIERLLGSLRGRPGSAAQTKRIASLASRFDALFPQLADDARDDALVPLRRRVLDETLRARAAGARTEAGTDDLASAVTSLRADAAARAQGAGDAARRATISARWLTGLVFLLGACLCALAALRIGAALGALRERDGVRTRLAEDLARLHAQLEQRVAERTDALQQHAQALQRVLDGMQDGVLSVRRDGGLLPERSATVARWLGPPAAAAKVWDYLFAGDPAGGAQLRAGFEQLVAGALPPAECLARMPDQMVRTGRTYELAYQPVHADDGSVFGVVLVVRDVTAEREARRAAQLAREAQCIIANLLRDKRGFAQMVRECEQLVAQVFALDDPAACRRALHVLKSNCAIFGFFTVAELAHALETRIDAQETLRDSDAEELARGWQESMARAEEYVHHAQALEDVGERDLQLVLSALRQRIDYKEIVHLVASWRLEPAAAPLKRLATQAKRIAASLGKEVEVQVSDGGVRLPPERFQPLFAAAVHAVRNALEHGIEPPELRRVAGKPRAGTLTLSFTGAPPNAVSFALADDGAGIDFDAVATKARLRGMAARTREELIEALFTDGFSTAARVTKLSGRGLGLSALRATCEALSGSVALESTPGRGTTLRCTLPLLEVTRARSSIPPASSPPSRSVSQPGRTSAASG